MTEPDPISAGVAWLANLLTGTLAVAIATIAVAAVGLLMLDGRLPGRRGAAVIVGCFVLFAAPPLAAALSDRAVSVPPVLPAVPEALPQTAQVPPADPYAFASVIQ